MTVLWGWCVLWWVMDGSPATCASMGKALGTESATLLGKTFRARVVACAAAGGGYVFQSDHSVSSNVDPATYDFAVRLVREHGNYPLDLAELGIALDAREGARR